MADKITMDSRYAARKDVDKFGRLLPGRKPVQLLSVTRQPPNTVAYERDGVIQLTLPNGSYWPDDQNGNDLVPLTEPWCESGPPAEYVPWTSPTDVPFGAAFQLLGGPSRMIHPCEVNETGVVLHGELINYLKLYHRYGWTLDGKMWGKCGKPKPPAPAKPTRHRTPTLELVELSQREFVLGYPLVTNHLSLNTLELDASGDRNCLFEAIGAQLEYVRRQSPELIWTMIEAEGDHYICSGYRVVNRSGYFLSTVPRPDGQQIEVSL